MTEISSDPRLRLALPVKVEWKLRDGSSVSLKTVSHNVSHSGLCLILEKEAPTPAFGQTMMIKVDQGRLSVEGTVKHITRHAESWHIGLELSAPVFEWLARYRHCNPMLLREIIPTTLSKSEGRLKQPGGSND